MANISALLLLLVTFFLTEKCFGSPYVDNGNIVIEVNDPDKRDDSIELKLLQDIGKLTSLVYTFTTDCVPKGGSCYYNYASCCANLGCFCNRWAFNCHCKPYYASAANENEDATIATDTKPKA